MATNEKATKDAYNGYPFVDVMSNVKKKYTPSRSSFVLCTVVEWIKKNREGVQQLA